MLIRASVASLGSALLLVALSQVLQGGVQFEVSHLAWALAFSLPVGLSVLWGSLGTERIEYPNSTLGALMFWIMTVGPWLITDKPDLVFDLPYSDQAVLIGRLLFLVWCLVFTLAAGRAARGLARLNPNTVDTIALSTPIILSLASQLARGQFTDYQSGFGGDTKLVIAVSLGKNTLAFLPGLFLLLAKRSRSATLVWLSRAFGIFSVVLMLLSGGRRSIAFAIGYAFLFARLSGLRFRLGPSVAAAIAAPLCFFFMFTYRSALSVASIEFASLPQLTSIASDTARSLASGGELEGQAVDDFSENVRVRMGIGPQFYAVVESWLAKGPALEGTWLDGVISVLPVYFFPDKNEMAVQHNFEYTLQRARILPEVDLSPTPWMHWLYEFGALGLVLGATLAGRLVRFLERRLIETQSLFELVFWTYLLAAIYPAEQTFDTIVLVARDALVLVGCGWILSTLWRGLILATRTKSGTPSAAMTSTAGVRAAVTASRTRTPSA